jgi:hypothetical protein
MKMEFVPPQMSGPQNIPQAPGGAMNNTPNMASNIPASFEKQSQWARSVGRSHQIKAATSAVIQTRGQLVDYLKQHGMDLLTSSIEFQQTGDFILSSYVVYPQHNNQKEPLGDFLQRYPFLQEGVLAIRDQLRPVQSNMQVITPKTYPGMPGQAGF